MNLENYTPYWEAVRPVMQAKMETLVTALRGIMPSGLKVTAPSVETNTDEFRISADIIADDGTVVVGTHHDGHSFRMS